MYEMGDHYWGKPKSWQYETPENPDEEQPVEPGTIPFYDPCTITWETDEWYEERHLEEEALEESEWEWWAYAQGYESFADMREQTCNFLPF